jgi:hypothetical protein
MYQMDMNDANGKAVLCATGDAHPSLSHWFTVSRIEF